ncbi:hypothetical protein F4775DRAFT_593117 [Biscogniauxia sp. FL1348]|nr:hypothetical protein F4775DRAFT_593117 [Biscogniauxia sp. FL1348]
MPILRKLASRKGGDGGEIGRPPSPVTPSPNGSHVDPTNEPGDNKGSMRNRIKEIKGSIRGNIKKRLSTGSISFSAEEARAGDDKQQQSWLAWRNSINSIAISLRNHRTSLESRSSQETARQPMLNRSRIGPRVSQDDERRSHTVHGRPTTPTLIRSGSNMRRFSLGTMPEPSSDNDSTPRLPSLHNMLARTESKASSKYLLKGIGGQLGLFGDSGVPVFEIDWHATKSIVSKEAYLDIESHIPGEGEEAGKQKSVARDHAPIPGRLPIRIKQAQPSATKKSPDDPSVVSNDKKRGSTSDSGIFGCLEPAVEYLLAGHEATEEHKTSQGSPQSDVLTPTTTTTTTTTTTESSRRISIKWANQVLDADATTATTTPPTTAPTTPEPPAPLPNTPRPRAPFQSSGVPTRWLDRVLETSLPLRACSSPPPPPPIPRLLPYAPHRHRHRHRASGMAVVAPTRTGERQLPRLRYADFGAATRDLFRRFRYQYAPLMALVPGARAIYLFAPDVARREDVEARMRELLGPGKEKEREVCVFDIEDVLDGDWGGWREVLGRGTGMGMRGRGIGDGYEADDEEDVEVLSAGGGVGETETDGDDEEADRAFLYPRESGLEWVDPEGEAYMRSEISLLQDYDDLEMASRLG